MADDGLAILLGLGGLLIGSAIKEKEIQLKRNDDRKSIRETNRHIESCQNENARLKQQCSKLLKQIKPLEDFHRKKMEEEDLFRKRYGKLTEYHLTEILDTMDSAVKQTFEESLKCFITGHDLAASNMLALTVEIMVRNKYQYEDKNSETLFKIIEILSADKNIDPVVKQNLHLLREFRNNQNHSINKLDELDFLSLVKNIGALYNILRSKGDD